MEPQPRARFPKRIFGLSFQRAENGGLHPLWLIWRFFWGPTIFRLDSRGPQNPLKQVFFQKSA